MLDETEYLSAERQATDKHEFVDGMVYAMAGAGEIHNRIAGNVFLALRLAARGSGCGVYISDMKLRISGGRLYYYPDVMLSCEPSTGDSHYKEHPCVVVEVLSASTGMIDVREKLHAYRSIESLRYYLMIDSEKVEVTCYTRDDAGQWLTSALELDERLLIECGPVRCELDLATLYEDTGLSARPGRHL